MRNPFNPTSPSPESITFSLSDDRSVTFYSNGLVILMHYPNAALALQPSHLRDLLSLLAIHRPDAFPKELKP